MRIRDVALPALTCALLVGTAQLAAPPASAAATSWTADLGGGDAVGVVVADGAARLDLSGAHLMPADSDGAPVPTGLLTLDAHRLAAPTDRIGTEVAADLPVGSTAGLDVRGRRADGAWTEWVPAVDGVAALPERVPEVQGRLVLTDAGEGEPAVHDVVLDALPASAEAGTPPVGAPLSYRVFATREGLTGGTTANGHVIAERDHFVALPSRRALSPRGTSDYSVKVCAPNGRCAFAPVWDVGPWNTRDDYWNPPAQRQEWKDLPQGVPQAQAARLDGHNAGRDQYGRQVANPAGIDLGDGLFWDALGLEDNSWVTVDYLWTGADPLSAVVAPAPVDVRAAPSPVAAVVGVAAERAALPVECALTEGDRTWLRVGPDQYVDAEAVPDAEAGPCTAGPEEVATGDPVAAGSGGDAVDGEVREAVAEARGAVAEALDAVDALDLPAADLPAVDVPAVDVPAVDVPAVDVPIRAVVEGRPDHGPGTTDGCGVPAPAPPAPPTG
jgi:hypothetical protein